MWKIYAMKRSSKNNKYLYKNNFFVVKRYSFRVWVKKVIHGETVPFFVVKRYPFCGETVPFLW